MGVSIKDIDAVVKRLNVLTNNKETAYSRIDGKYVANIGNYHVYQAYGAYGLHQMQTNGCGIKVIIDLGTKKELYFRLQSFISGIEYGKGV